MIAARHIGSLPSVVQTSARAISDVYPTLIQAADCPVVDTSCAALWSLAGEVHRQGYKVALTGEGADEALAGYIWFKSEKIQQYLEFGGLIPRGPGNRVFRNMMAKDQSLSELKRIDALTCGPYAQSEMYSFVANSRSMFYSAGMKEKLRGFTAYQDSPSIPNACAAGTRSTNLCTSATKSCCRACCSITKAIASPCRTASKPAIRSSTKT